MRVCMSVCVCVSPPLLMHANEKQLRGPMRLCSARPVQRREPGRPLSPTDTHWRAHTRAPRHITHTIPQQGKKGGDEEESWRDLTYFH